VNFTTSLVLHQDSQGPQMFLFSRTRLDAKSYALFR